jgi:hypothetical protein
MVKTKKTTKKLSKSKIKNKTAPSKDDTLYVVACESCKIRFVFKKDHKNTKRCALCDSSELKLAAWG